jgi:hypothetical protein
MAATGRMKAAAIQAAAWTVNKGKAGANVLRAFVKLSATAHQNPGAGGKAAGLPSSSPASSKVRASSAMPCA